ncbi:MAG TPA: hypothetical protein VKA38_15025 [Draconibacterium sp.]|nr:hypothetical protein [Draconibacterium sp.]
MKKLIILATLFIGLSSCTKHTVVISESDLKEDIFYLKDEIKPFSGTCLVYYDGTDQVKESLTFKNGILDGKAISYYECGSIKRKGNYKHGRLNGRWESWTEKGKKTYEVNYENDTLNGEATVWFSSGVVKEKGLYAENHKSGVWVVYDEAGMILSKKNF